MTALASPSQLGNLDARRLARAQSRAASREALGETLPIVFGGAVIAELGAEFPLFVLEPLQDLNVDVALLIQQAVANATADDASTANMALILNVLAANPNLPRELVIAIGEIGRRLLGEDGYAAFVAAQPSPWDVAALITDLFSWYGSSLGESWRSSTSSGPGGPTSNTTSSTTSESTPGVPAPAPAPLAS